MLAIIDRSTEKQMQAIVDRRAITDRHSEKWMLQAGWAKAGDHWPLYRETYAGDRWPHDETNAGDHGPPLWETKVAGKKLCIGRRSMTSPDADLNHKL